MDGAPHVYRFRATHDDTPAETPPVLRLVLALWWPGPGVGWGVVWRHGWSEICSYGVPRVPPPPPQPALPRRPFFGRDGIPCADASSWFTPMPLEALLRTVFLCLLGPVGPMV